MEEGQGQTISCAAHGCDILVDDETVFNLITDSRVKTRYQHLITNTYVAVSGTTQFCYLVLTDVMFSYHSSATAFSAGAPSPNVLA